MKKFKTTHTTTRCFKNRKPFGIQFKCRLLKENSIYCSLLVLTLFFQLDMVGQTFVTNGNTLSAGDKLGSLNNVELSIYTNNLERARFTPDGNLGIGTSAPAQKLHIIGNQILTGNFIEVGKGLSGNRNVYFDFVGDDTYTDYGLRIIRSNGGENGNSDVLHRGTGTLSLTTMEEGDVKIKTSLIDRLTVKGSTGNVGIGTATPTQKLYVVGNQALQGNFLKIGLDMTGDRNAYVDFIADDSNTYGLRIIRPNGGANTNSNIFHRGTGVLYLNAVDDGGSIRLRTFGIDALTVKGGSGNVGIGTTNPVNSFTVKQGSHAATIPSDYVASITHSTNATNKYGLIVGTNWSDAENFVANFGGYNATTGDFSSYLAVKGNGNIGIGTTAPISSLDIRSGTAQTGSTLNVLKSFNGVGNTSAAFIGGTDVGITNSGIYVMQKDNTGLTSSGSNLLNVVVDGVSKMIVTGVGNMGVGTTLPENLFSVRKGPHTATISTDYIASITHAHNTTNKYGLIVGTNWSDAENFVANFGGYNATTGDFSSYLAVKGNGNIGIGTTAPISSLDIRSGTAQTGSTLNVLKSFNGVGNTSAAFIGGTDVGITNSGIYVMQKDNTDLTSSGSNLLNVVVDGISKMLVTGVGNVGIGIDNPAYALDVKGEIRACEVYIENPGWCDYVFEENYNRMPVNDLEDYLKRNKHLPGVKSAKQFEKEGVRNLGETQQVMMEKMEELYLYVIDLNKKVEVLEKENAKLKQGEK